LTAVLGAVTVFVFSQSIVGYAAYFVGFAAGNFLYIAASDLLPELQHTAKASTSFWQTLAIAAGATMMFYFTRIFVE